MPRRTPLTYAIAVAVLAACHGCKNDGPSGQNPSASSSAAAQPKPYAALGLSFSYPATYSVELSTSNPEAHQIAVSSTTMPGVLTIRLNSVDPTAPIDLDKVAETTRATMDPAATIDPTSMKVGTQPYDARAIKSASLGLVPVTDVVAVVPMGGRNYLIMLHAANEDVAKAATMFGTVLGSLKPQ